MNKRALAVFVACFLTIFSAYAIRYGYGLLITGMLPALAITKTEAGVIFSSFFVAYTVMSPVLGLLGDRCDVRLILGTFVAILGAGTFLVAYSSSVTQASLFFTLAGIGAAACWAPVMALTQRWASDKHRGKTLAFVDVGSSLGIIGTSTVVTRIIGANDWKAGWMSLGILGLAVAAINFLVVKNPPDWQPETRKAESERIAGDSIGTVYKMLFRDSRFWLIGTAYMLMAFSVIIPFTFLSTYAVEELSFSYESAAGLITVTGIGAMAGKLVIGFFSDRTGRIEMMMLCSVLVAAGSLGMALTKGAALFLFTAVFSAGFGAFWPMYAVAASDHFPREHAGSIIGLWTVFMGVGSIISPVVSGWLADINNTLSYSFILATGGSALSLLLLIPVWRMKKA